MHKQYETVFIITPLLTEDQVKGVAQKYRDYLASQGAEIIHEENWGLRKLAYPIKKKTNGFYHLIEFKADPSIIDRFELEFRRDEQVLRYLTVIEDRHMAEYNSRRVKGEVGNKEKMQNRTSQLEKA
ncbi:MAG: 30S ribosomal protein S6 [Bacteroidetes bacterium]|jgi:small subunit ribosomal protein S6|nr:30S ribosomal protein S6 [Bacteroidota bacterium]